MKVYAYYYQKELYAITVTKMRKKRFVKERGLNNLTEKVIHMDKIEYSAFAQTNHTKLLVEIPLVHNGKNVSLIGTYEEEYKLSAEFDNMNEISEDCIRAIYTINFTNDTKKLLIDMVTCRDMGYESTINTFDLFIDLFKNTFSI